MAFRPKDAFWRKRLDERRELLVHGQGLASGDFSPETECPDAWPTHKSRDSNSIYFAGLIRPLPETLLTGWRKIFRPGLSGCGTVGKPVPLHAGQLTSVDTVIDFIMAIIAQK
jgi:hypothetical protein